MRAGVDTALARVVSVFGEARAHHAYLFVNKRANRVKVLVHDGFGLWLCARKLYEGCFIRAGVRHDRGMQLSHEQLQAIVVGLPWERLDERAKIRVRISRKEGHRFKASRSMVSRHAGPLLVKQDVLDFPSRTIIRQ